MDEQNPINEPEEPTEELNSEELDDVTGGGNWPGTAYQVSTSH